MSYKCNKCNQKPVIFQKYSGMHLCAQHFIEDVERKIKLSIRKEMNINKNDTIAVALSGGKDSSVLVYILQKIFKHRPDISLLAISVDEGIHGYRNSTIESAKELADKLDVKHQIVSFQEEFGKTLDDLVARKRIQGACTYCGVLRKHILNRVAREMGANKLATGHNLDDEAQTILLNHIRGDVERLVRLAPTKELDGLVLRAKPLRKIPEKEVALYAYLHNLPVDYSECPYAKEAMRGEIRDHLNELEVNHPGTKYSLLSGFDKMVKILATAYPETNIGSCKICNEPCTSQLCQACKILNSSIE